MLPSLCAVVVTRFERKRAAQQQLSCAYCVFAEQLAVVLSAKRPPYFMPLSLSVCLYVCVCMWVLLLYLQLLQVERSKTADVSRLLVTTRCRHYHSLFAHQLFHSTASTLALSLSLSLSARLCSLTHAHLQPRPGNIVVSVSPCNCRSADSSVPVPAPVCVCVCVLTCIRDFCAG